MANRRECTICLGECFIDSVQLPCTHQYHKECLNRQLDIEGNTIKCAECRTIYEFSEDRTKIIQDRKIFVKFTKEGIHRYPAAPAGVEFLQHPHRHIFHFRVTVSVTHNDRDIEFILFKRELENLYSGGTMEVDFKSCEMLAEELITYITKKYPGRSGEVEVSEDDENGAILSFYQS